MLFKTPLVLLLIPIVLGLSIYFRTKEKPSAFVFPSLELMKTVPSTWKMRLQILPFILRLAALILFCAALAGPRSILEQAKTEAEGIDIILALDASGSMQAEDFKINGQRQNRLSVVKKVVEDFINRRRHDRIGLVAFGGQAYTVCPMTTDYRWLKENLERIELGVVNNGTAIGSGIATAVNRLKNSQAASRIVILLTDGANNAGKIDPSEAARAAAALGIRIYTIGAGSSGMIPYPAVDLFGRKGYQYAPSDLDENLLQEIARATGGKYFRATDTESLERIYAEIDRLEKVKIEQVGYTAYKEWFTYPLMLALIVLLLEVVLTRTVFLKIP